MVEVSASKSTISGPEPKISYAFSRRIGYTPDFMAMKRVAEGSGVALLEEPDRLRFVRYAHETAFVGAFLLGLATLSCLQIGLVIFRRSSAGDALLPLAIGVLTAIPFLLIVRHIVRGRRRVELLTPLAIIDFGSRQLCDGSGRPLAPLDEVAFHTEAQFSSSSPKITARFGHGEKLVLVKGDPFGGGVRRLVDALRERSLMR
jgi:hypothetical protein